MHELGIATGIADLARQVMRDNSAESVGSITLEVGMLAGVDPSSLEFCFQSITKGTPLEAARLKIEEIAPEARCRKCSKEYQVRMDDFRCRYCGSLEFDVIRGAEISVREMEVE